MAFNTKMNNANLFEIIPAGCNDEESFLMLRCPDLSHVLFQIEADGQLLEASPLKGDYDLSAFHGEKTLGQSQISLVSYRELFRTLPAGTGQCSVTIIYTEN